jgi:hypothetical protein
VQVQECEHCGAVMDYDSDAEFDEYDREMRDNAETRGG